MPGMRCAKWVALVGVLALTGCCSWCDKHCPNCHQPAPAAYPPCVPCCPAPACAPAPVAYGPAPAAAPQTWQRQFPPQQMNCTCTPAQ